MNLFYIKHHYKSVVRSRSFDGEIFAFVIILLLGATTTYPLFLELDIYASAVSNLFGQETVNYKIILGLYVSSDLSFRLVLKRPQPKLKYYLLWIDKPREISLQYLLTSLFGIIPFLLAFPMVVFAAKAFAWLGISGSLAIIFWWVTNHFIGLSAQFSGKTPRAVVTFCILTLFALQYFIPSLTSMVQFTDDWWYSISDSVRVKWQA